MARILVVDDDEAVRTMFRHVLERVGHTCDEAADASGALAAVERDDIELVLCDLRLSGDDGLALARAILARDGGPAVVMVTGHDDATTAQTALDSGAYGYVVKPIGPSELRVHVANALRRRRVELEHRNFVQNVSHELRTPLTVILAGAALLRRAEGRSEVDEIATSIEDHGRRLLALVDRLVQVTTLDAPFTPDRGVAVDVRTLLSVAAQPARTAGRTVEVRAPADGPPLLAVQERLVQAVANVVDNACRFAGNGPITLQAVADGGDWVIEVVDHGPGVPAARLERMWDAFTQGDSGPTRAHGGLGVGLYLCRRIVEWHGGSVSADETPGGGLTVRIRLPRYASATSQ